MIKLSHVISEIRKITLQIGLFMIFMSQLMLWKSLHMIYKHQEAIYEVAQLYLILSKIIIIASRCFTPRKIKRILNSTGHYEALEWK